MSITPEAQQLLQSYKERRVLMLKHNFTDMTHMLALCTSSAQQIFLAAYILEFGDRSHCFLRPSFNRGASIRTMLRGDRLKHTIEVHPQHTIPVGDRQYQVDFLFSQADKHAVVVEIGAQESYERDRDLIINGYTVLYFTEAEIYNDAATAIKQVIACLPEGRRRKKRAAEDATEDTEPAGNHKE